MSPADQLSRGLNESGHRIARNSLINLLGVVLPLSAGLFAIPKLIAGMGTERFGVLTLAWMIVGYFNFVEFGISRAMTLHVAAWISAGREHQIGSLIWTGVVIAVVLGVAAGLGFLGIALVAVTRVLNISTALHGEATVAAAVLAIALPFVLPSLALRGALQAIHRFDLVNFVRGFVGLNSFLGPLIALQFTTSLVPMVWVLVLGRAVGFLLYAFVLEWKEPYLWCDRPRLEHVRTLVSTGGWMVVSNIISPILVYLDRVLIAWLLGITAIAYYFTSFEITTKVLLIPAALAAVLFPVFSALNVVSAKRLTTLYGQSVTSLFIILFPVVLVIGVFSEEILKVWVGPEFSLQGYRVMQILALGVLANGIASIPFSCLQGRGQARTTAMIHLIELPLSILAFYWLTRCYGIIGAATAWTVRVWVDGLVMHWFATRRMGLRTFNSGSSLYVVIVVGILLLLFYSDLSISIRVYATLVLGISHALYYRNHLLKMVRMIKSSGSGAQTEATK